MSLICPNCKSKIKYVHVYSQCKQTADIDENKKISNYSSVEHIFETQAVECPECCESIEGWEE